MIEENEHYQEQMQALQQQIEQMGQQMEQMNAENQNLKKAVTQTSNALSQMSARRGGQRATNPTGPEGMPQPQGLETENPIVGGAVNTLGQPTGTSLPT